MLGQDDMRVNIVERVDQPGESDLPAGQVGDVPDVHHADLLWL